jgi:hypothetical protein
MQFTTSAIAAILAFTSTAAATPLQARQSTLSDWQVTSVGIGTPSGRPGSYPWSTLTASITDPNQIDLGPAKDDGSPVTVPAGSQGLVRLTLFLTLFDILTPHPRIAKPSTSKAKTHSVVPGLAMPLKAAATGRCKSLLDPPGLTPPGTSA